MAAKGIVAAGHPETANAAALVLDEGGNAFDAALAALAAAGVSEPILASMGGGGFLLARPEGAAPILYDFFAQTPKGLLRPDPPDFFPIHADFGVATQEFHVGMGSIAVPGIVRGLIEAHRDLGRMPLAEVLAPAIALAKEGVILNRLQAYLFEVVGVIYVLNDACRAIYGRPDDPTRPLAEGDRLALPELADLLDALACEGADLFYRGEVAARAARDCAERGGWLHLSDFEAYRVERRRPLEVSFAEARLVTNPAPSTGGALIGFGLGLLEGEGGDPFGSFAHLDRLARVMELTSRVRIELALHEQGDAASLLDPALLARYRAELAGHPQVSRGTTHISVIDAVGNAAAITVSNGEGSGYVIPGTGVMLNNMLGEEDINPHGFHRWPKDVRLGSMMAPSLLFEPDGAVVALGSGGSNRIRTAILQVVANLRRFGMTLEAAVEAPRIHYEGGVLGLEGGFDQGVVERLCAVYPDHRIWEGLNLFFGGVHAVRHDPRRNDFYGAGDPRRGGVARRV